MCLILNESLIFVSLINMYLCNTLLKIKNYYCLICSLYSSFQSLCLEFFILSWRRDRKLSYRCSWIFPLFLTSNKSLNKIYWSILCIYFVLFVNFCTRNAVPLFYFSFLYTLYNSWRTTILNKHSNSWKLVSFSVLLSWKAFSFPVFSLTQVEFYLQIRTILPMHFPKKYWLFY